MSTTIERKNGNGDAKVPEAPGARAVALVRQHSPALQRLGCKDTGRVVESLRVLMSEQPYLAKVASDPEGARSLCVAVARAMALGLDPSGGPLGQAYLVPFGKAVSLIPGYKGLVGLALRDGLVKSVHAEIVFEGDAWDLDLGSDRHLKHRPGLDKSREVYAYTPDGGTDGSGNKDNPPVLAYCVWSVEGRPGFEFTWMSMADVMLIRGRSASWKNNKASSPWLTDPEAMVLKTVIRKASKLWGIGLAKPAPAFAEALRRLASEDMGEMLPEDRDIIDLPGNETSTDQTRAQDSLADDIRSR